MLSCKHAEQFSHVGSRFRDHTSFALPHSDALQACPVVAHELAVWYTAGVFPLTAGPYYAAAKANIMHFIWSLAPRLALHGFIIRCVLTGIFPLTPGPYYAAAKAGVVHFTRSLAPRLAPYGIQLAAICPQYVDTPLIQTMLKNQPELAKVGIKHLSSSGCF